MPGQETNAVSAVADLTADQMHNAVSATALSCTYEYVCGQGANGNRFSYAKCGVVYELPNLIGVGPLNNNQTRGTLARFYDSGGRWIYSSIAPHQTTVDWTPIWYVQACDYG